MKLGELRTDTANRQWVEVLDEEFTSIIGYICISDWDVIERDAEIISDGNFPFHVVHNKKHK